MLETAGLRTEAALCKTQRLGPVDYHLSPPPLASSMVFYGMLISGIFLNSNFFCVQIKRYLFFIDCILYILEGKNIIV